MAPTPRGPDPDSTVADRLAGRNPAMTSLDAEALRQEYNEHYRSPVDHWSCHDPAQAADLVAFVLRQMGVLAGTPVRSGSVLDVGCAKGHICEAFRQAGWEASGLDYSDVAVAAATGLFPRCRFYHMDGMNPHFDRRFDLVFMRGFSGCNSLDLEAVATVCNRYIALLPAGGFLVLAYSTDFSGRHSPGDTVCWNRRQLERLHLLLDAPCLGMVAIPPRNLFNEMRVRIGRLLGRRPKYYLYQFLRSAPSAAKPGKPG